jgi:hypothetical protein
MPTQRDATVVDLTCIVVSAGNTLQQTWMINQPRLTLSYTWSTYGCLHPSPGPSRDSAKKLSTTCVVAYALMAQNLRPSPECNMSRLSSRHDTYIRITNVASEFLFLIWMSAGSLRWQNIDPESLNSPPPENEVHGGCTAPSDTALCDDLAAIHSYTIPT